MKATLLCLALGITAAMAVVVDPPNSNAQQQAPVPVVITPTGAQYKVIDIAQIPVGNNQTPAATLEVLLNELAAQGWKVVTTSGTLIIFSR